MDNPSLFRWKPGDYPRADVAFGIDLQGASVQLHDLFADGKAQSGTLFAIRTDLPATVKTLKQSCAVFLSYTDPGVCNGKLNPNDTLTGLRASRNLYCSSAGGKLDRIGNQVADQLAQLSQVTVDPRKVWL